MLVDSHCHLNMLETDVDQVLKQAREHGVHYFLNVAVTLTDFPALVAIAEKYPQVFISAGLHPNELPHQSLDITQLTQQSTHPKVIAIGETGLDYYRSEGDIRWQQERFIQHIELAISSHKPLIIHTRQAKEDTLALMRAHQADSIGGIMHCFTEDWEMAKAALDLNFYISFSGIVTFKNATIIQDVAKRVPLDKMLVETDSPYLAPVPHRGKPNAPAFVSFVAEYIAALRGESFERIAQQTTENFFTLFRIAH